MRRADARPATAPRSCVCRAGASTSHRGGVGRVPDLRAAARGGRGAARPPGRAPCRTASSPGFAVRDLRAACRARPAESGKRTDDRIGGPERILGFPWPAVPPPRRPTRQARSPGRRRTRSRGSRRRSPPGSATRSPPRRGPRSEGWAAIAAGGHVLLHAPTGQRQDARRVPVGPRPARPGAGSAARRPGRGIVRILYVSPLKALTYDVERNLRAPLAGIALAGRRLGIAGPDRLHRLADRRHAGGGAAAARQAPAGDPHHDARVALPPADVAGRARSCAAWSTSSSTRSTRSPARSGAPTWPSRSSAWSACAAPDGPPLQRIGLSATQRPLETIGRFLGGAGAGRAVTIVDAGTRKALDLSGRRARRGHEPARRAAPARGAARRPGRPGREGRVSIWPAIYPRILELIREPPEHDRLRQQPAPRGAARPAAQRAGRRGPRAGPPRLDRPRAAGRDRGGAQGGPPAGARGHLARWSSGSTWARSTSSSRSSRRRSVARGLQRIGRAGHQVDEVSTGVIFPKYRGDLLECAVVAERMRDGRDRGDGDPAQPARRAGPADRGDGGDGPLDRWTTSTPR